MQTWRFTFQPKSPFATPLLGDTLFGQLCWTIRHHAGEARLNELLGSYLSGQPFCVLSDAFPSGYLPRPHLPLFSIAPSEDVDANKRKQWKSKKWLPLAEFYKPVTEWLEHCQSSDELYKHEMESDKLSKSEWQKEEGRMHNSINRLTGTTGEGGFAPYAVAQSRYHPNALLDVYAVVDDTCFNPEELIELLQRIGATGFGKDASTGLGHYIVVSAEPFTLTQQPQSTAWMVLAPCAPQQQGFVPEKSYWQPFTRYGRHGSLAAIGGQPFKNPVLLTQAGSVFTPAVFDFTHFIGQGFGGNGSLSKAIPATVQQGYAPVMGLNLSDVHQWIAEVCSGENV